MASALRRLIRQAELYGTGDVWAVASRVLDAGDQGSLALHLRRIDPGWKLSRIEAMNLAERLAAAGHRDKDIRRMAGVSQPTVRKARDRAAQSESFEGVQPIGPREEAGRENAA